MTQWMRVQYLNKNACRLSRVPTDSLASNKGISEIPDLALNRWPSGGANLGDCSEFSSGASGTAFQHLLMDAPNVPTEAKS